MFANTGNWFVTWATTSLCNYNYIVISILISLKIGSDETVKSCLCILLFIDFISIFTAKAWPQPETSETTNLERGLHLSLSQTFLRVRFLFFMLSITISYNVFFDLPLLTFPVIVFSTTLFIKLSTSTCSRFPSQLS